MRGGRLVLGIFLLIFLMACSSADVEIGYKENVSRLDETSDIKKEVVEKQPISEKTENISTNKSEQKEESVEEKNEEEQTLDSQVQELIDRRKKLESYSYYRRVSDESDSSQYFIKDNLIKIKFSDVENYRDDIWIETVYLNRTDLSAVGYCEKYKLTRCEDPNRGEEISYSTYYELTPKDWVELIERATKKSSETFEDRKVIVLEFNGKGKTGRMWVDEFYGVARKVRVDGKMIYFTDMLFNVVEKEQVTHQKIIKEDD